MDLCPYRGFFIEGKQIRLVTYEYLEIVEDSIFSGMQKLGMLNVFF